MNQTFKKNLLALGVATAIGASTSAYAQIASENPGVNGTVPNVAGGAMLLFDQTDNASGNGAPDQDFEAGYDVYDAEGADDFVVDFADGWTIEQVTTVGTQSAGGTPNDVTITFFTDNAGAPGTPIPECTYPNLAPTGTDSFVIDLPTACILGPGTYWMSQITSQNFGGGNGQHFFSNRTTQTGNPGHWRNPGDGFGSGCIDFTPMTTCGVGGGTNPDFLFQILGQLGGFATLPPPPAVPTFNRWGIGILAVMLLAGGLLVRRQRTQ